MKIRKLIVFLSVINFQKKNIMLKKLKRRREFNNRNKIS